MSGLKQLFLVGNFPFVEEYTLQLVHLSDMLHCEICIGSGAFADLCRLEAVVNVLQVKAAKEGLLHWTFSYGEFSREERESFHDFMLGVYRGKSFAEPSRRELIPDYPCIIKGSAKDLEELSAFLLPKLQDIDNVGVPATQVTDEQLVNSPAENDRTSKQSDLSPAGEKKLPTLEDIPKIVQILKDQMADKTARLDALRMARLMLSVEHDPPVKQIIDSGLLAKFVDALTCDDDNDPSLQLEAAWALSRVASTKFTHEVVSKNPIRKLVRLLECDGADVREQAVLCLGNIAGHCLDCRDKVLKARALPSM